MFDRYRRVAEPGACTFCLMLETRDAVYYTEESAGGEGNEYHANCHCEVVLEADFGGMEPAVTDSDIALAMKWSVDFHKEYMSLLDPFLIEVPGLPNEQFTLAVRVLKMVRAAQHAKQRLRV